MLSICPASTGELSLDEFIDGARRDKWVMKMLQMDVNPGTGSMKRDAAAPTPTPTPELYIHQDNL